MPCDICLDEAQYCRRINCNWCYQKLKIDLVHEVLVFVKWWENTCFLRRVWISILLNAFLIVSSWVLRFVSESKFSISRFETFEYLPLIPQNRMSVASTWQLEMTRMRIFLPISVICSSSELAIVPVGSIIASSFIRKLVFEESIGIAFGSNCTHSLKTIELSTKMGVSWRTVFDGLRLPVEFGDGTLNDFMIPVATIFPATEEHLNAFWNPL